ncbi:hypothetical protein EYF80_053351 [Liparis tanakae]|uniref:Uncharacterized protein n=1 Tax=Liparis tanakae TaxID=230148 RepID=A0A4Z2F6K0_9TELE|nr:hypothetical protein EYF80_053351 [Liparis tanakae]
MIVCEGGPAGTATSGWQSGSFRVDLGTGPGRPERASFPLGLSAGIPLLTPEPEDVQICPYNSLPLISPHTCSAEPCLNNTSQADCENHANAGSTRPAPFSEHDNHNSNYKPNAIKITRLLDSHNERLFCSGVTSPK